MQKKLEKTLIDVLEKTEEHLTVKELFEMLKNETSIADEKIYKELLDKLENSKKIVSLVGAGGIKHYDFKKDLHFHFICDKCGVVKNISIETGAINMFKNHAQSILNSYAKIDKINISFQGFCHNCRNEFKNH